VDAAGVVTTPAVYDGMLEPSIYSGMGIAAAFSDILGKNAFIGNLMVIMMVLALLLSIMTSMAGSSRTLYQASVDGWLPKYLSYVNDHGAPTKAMWTDLCFNLLLLLMSDYVFVLAASNIGYIIFNFLNLNSGWIHRMDRANWERPYKAPTILIALGGILGFVNLGIMGMGADIWGAGTLKTGLVFASLIIPVFIYRHYVQDKGSFPKQMLEDLYITGDDTNTSKKAGVLPYVALAAGVLLVWYMHSL
jgi:amino acid transporter